MKRIAVVLVILCLVLAGCGGQAKIENKYESFDPYGYIVKNIKSMSIADLKAMDKDLKPVILGNETDPKSYSKGIKYYGYDATMYIDIKNHEIESITYSIYSFNSEYTSNAEMAYNTFIMIRKDLADHLGSYEKLYAASTGSAGDNYSDDYMWEALNKEDGAEKDFWCTWNNVPGCTKAVLSVMKLPNNSLFIYVTIE